MSNAPSPLVVLASLCCLAAVAQQPAPLPAKEPTGAVIGHVICADTNLPARIASVTLQPIVDSPPPSAAKSSEPQPRTAITISETLLDGSFAIPNVKPGNYYIIAEKLGYLSPLAQLSREDLNHPTPETAALMARLLTPVTVIANRTTSTEVRLLKGAVISGTVHFDDGSPDAGANVALFRKDKLGKWTGFRTFRIARPSNSTDDQGHYRISGLPAGEYLAMTDLQLSNIVVDRIFSNSGYSSSSSSLYSLNIYYPDSTRQRDAKPIKLDDGQEADSIDIEIPLTRLHSVTGTVVESGTGQTVNAANVALIYPDDHSQLVHAQVGKEDDRFHFYFVPEGAYTVKVTNAEQVDREEVPSPRGVFPPTHTLEKKIRDYGVAEQPLTIQSDMTGVTLAVPGKATVQPEH